MSYRESREIIIRFVLGWLFILSVFVGSIDKGYAKIPEYCSNLQEGIDQQVRVECDNYRQAQCYKSNSSLSNLTKVSTQLVAEVNHLHKQDIRQAMYRLAMTRMLEKKFALTALYPSLNAGAKEFYTPIKQNRFRHYLQDASKLRRFKQCFSIDNSLQNSIAHAQQRYPQVKKVLHDKVNRLKYVADIIQRALEADQQWGLVAPLQKKLKRQQKEYQWAVNKSRMRGRYASKQQKQEMARITRIKQRALKQTKKELEHIKQNILQDPMWADTTSTFEWQDAGEFKDYKRSRFLSNLVQTIQGTKSRQYSGTAFLNYLHRLQKEGKTTEVRSRIMALLDASPSLFSAVEKKIKKKLAQQLKEVDRGIEQLCKKKGEGLASYPAIYEEVASQIAQQGIKNKQNISSLIRIFRKNHCDLIAQEQASHSSWAIFAGGGLLLVGAALAPFTGGGSLAVVGSMMAGGAILTTVGGIETYKSYQKLDMEKGLMQSKLVDMQTMRQTLHNVRINTGMSVLDVALMPMDIVGLIKVAGKSKKLAVIADKFDSTTREYAATKVNSTHMTAAEIKAQPAAQVFRKKYAKANIKLRNDQFIADMKKADPPGTKALYFDVENSILKKMNDVIFDDKELGDAAGNLFANKLYELIKQDPLLSKKLQFDYKDYKSLRLKFLLNEVEDVSQYEKRLAKIYQQANQNFVAELKKSKLSSLWAGNKTGQLGHPEQWFLAGVGDNALEANMATRTARELVETHPNGVMATFKQQQQAIKQHYSDILSYRDHLANNPKIIEHGIMHKGRSGQMILDDNAIEIVRKSTTSKGDRYQIEEIKEKIKKLYGLAISDDEVIQIRRYFDEVDAVSPPLFLNHREIIEYEKADKGIVSVDFAGIGVANARQAMEGVNIAAAKKLSGGKWVRAAIKEVDREVDKVTKSMNDAKEFYKKVVKSSYNDDKNIYFSGDDGIYMPQHELNDQEKVRAIKQIAQENPSQFRMTFVKTKYADGSSIPGELRSNMVVTAEKVEKAIRKDIVGVGVGKIDPQRAKQMMIVVDYAPQTAEQGKFKIFVEGKLSTQEKELIKKSFKHQMQKGQQVVGVEFIAP